MAKTILRAQSQLHDGSFSWVLIDAEHGLITDNNYYEVSSIWRLIYPRYLPNSHHLHDESIARLSSSSIAAARIFRAQTAADELVSLQMRLLLKERARSYVFRGRRNG